MRSSFTVGSAPLGENCLQIQRFTLRVWLHAAKLRVVDPVLVSLHSCCDRAHSALAKYALPSIMKFCTGSLAAKTPQMSHYYLHCMP